MNGSRIRKTSLALIRELKHEENTLLEPQLARLPSHYTLDTMGLFNQLNLTYLALTSEES